jgi:hypothetical protein
MMLCTSDSHLQSYLTESRDQKDLGLKPSLGKLASLSKPYARTYLKNTEHNKGLLEWLTW